MLTLRDLGHIGAQDNVYGAPHPRQNRHTGLLDAGYTGQ
jgi:hypothetical protein